MTYKKTFLSVIAVATLCVPFVAFAATLSRQLDIGSTGSDVTALQTFLAQDPTLYPQGLVTGYFGTLTAAAVSNFQARNGISNVGRVGPITLAALNAQMNNGTVTGGVQSGTAGPAITGVSVSAGRNNALVNWNTNQYAQGVVYYSTVPLTTYENANSVNVSGNTAMTDSGLHASQSVSLPNLSPNTTYYYLIYTTNQAGIVSVTWPSTFMTTN